MSTNSHDLVNPYTEEELEVFVEGFKSLRSYQPENGGSVSAEQFEEVVKLTRVDRNPEQMKVYTDHWNTHFGGRLPLDAVLNVLKNLHKNDAYFRSLVENLDRDKDGYITQNELEDLVKLVVVHDPALAGYNTTYENFLLEADTNKDGKVSVEECTEWFKKKIEETK